MMRILITGNLGYVGPWVTRQLRGRFPDATLIGVDMGYFAHCFTGRGPAPEAQLDVQYYEDIRRIEPGLLQDVDAIVHLAAISNDPMGKAYEDVTLDINYKAGIRLARLAKSAGVRSFVFASSCSVYGAAEDRPRTELSEVRPLTAYARSKVLTEGGLSELADSSFQVSCLRFATACGMSDRLRLDLVLNDFVASAIATGRIVVLSDGSPWRPLINVRDMARAIEWAVTRQPHAGGDFLVVNSGTDEWNYQVSDLAAAVARAIPGTQVEINQNAPPDKRSYRVDFSLFRSVAPEHQPQCGLEDTIAALRDGLADMRFSDPEFRNSAFFIRLQVLADLERRRLVGPTLEWLGRSRAAHPALPVGSASLA